MKPQAFTEARNFLQARIIGLTARARRLARIDYDSVGIRPQDLPYAPSPAHFQAANDRLAAIHKQVAKRLAVVEREWRRAPLQRVLIDIALVEREIDRARRAFGMFYEVFSQRGASFAPELAAHDVIAEDCYAAVREQRRGCSRARPWRRSAIWNTDILRQRSVGASCLRACSAKQIRSP